MKRSKDRTTTAAVKIDRWKTLNGFVADDLAELTQESGSASAGLVWFVLFTKADGRTGRVRAASRWLASATGLTRKTVIMALRSLIKDGLIERTDQKGWFLVRHHLKE